MINRDELMLIDFGMASFYVDKDAAHLPPANPLKTNIIGTPKYASWNIHCGDEYSRRDDLMSVVYVGLFLLHGSDLWSDCPVATAQPDKTSLSNPFNQWFQSRKTLERVLEISENDWPELAKFANEVYRLTFDETPNYERMEQLFSF
jgi:casein kinase 1